MKGTAVVTTTITVKPVYVTEVRDAEVVSSSKNSVTVQRRRRRQAVLAG